MDGKAPIRKTASNKVALTSYYGKAFFGRSELSKYDWSFWLLKNIFAISLDGTDRRISKLLRTKKNKPDIVVPRAYYALSGQVESFKSNGIDFNFDFYNREEIFGKEALSREKKGFIPVGFRGKEIVYIDMDNILYTRGGGKITPIKSIREHIGITSKEPVDMIFAKVYGKEIPISFMLGSYIGISKLIKLFKAEVREFPANTRDRLPDDSWLELLFKDKRLYVKKDNPKALMVFSGFTAIGDQLRTYNVSDLDKQSNYTPLILDMGLSPMIAKEFDIMKRYFIDPMTKDVLGQMKEPQKWLPLLERVVELLVTDDAPDETHPGYQRLRGYERIPGILYSEMVAAIRKHEMAPNTGNRKLEIPSWTITKAMTEDTSTQLVQDINPIHTLKQQEALTLSGAGGRSARTLVLRSRIYHDKDVGIVSESTPDSAKVAIRTFATPNSKIKGTNGLMGEFDDKTDNQTSLLSTNALLMPASHHDDPKRVALSGIQASAIVPCEGYMANPYSTSYDRVIASRVGDKYAFIAKGDGSVTKVGNYLKVDYKNGDKDAVKIGIWHGDVAGKYVSHTMVTDLTEGHKFKKGDVLAWNQGFFERDLFNPRNVVMKMGALSWVSLCEGNDTLEDGCAVSPRLAGNMATTFTKRKTIMVDFDQEIELLADMNNEVEYSDVLCRITNYIEGQDQTGASVSALEKFSGSNPKAGFTGKITSMRLIYMGDKEDMAPKLRELADRFDKELAKDKRELGGALPTTCQTKSSTFFGGEKVTENKLAISFFIDTRAEAGIGDKLVFGNQLKSIIGRVMEGVNRTESGIEIDARFGIRSVFARIVGSGFEVGAYNAMLYHGSMEFARLAEGG